MASEEYGPCLPPDFSLGVVEDDLPSSESRPNDEPPSYGPCLPPGMVGRESGESRMMRPALPPPGVRALATGEEGGEVNCTGESSLRLEEDENEAELIGPALPGPNQEDYALKQIRESFESRSKAMQERISSKYDDGGGPRREEWMVALPPSVRITGVGARKFQTQDRDLGDRSVWTDTPADRERKRLEQSKREGQDRRERRSEREAGQQAVMSKRDQEMEELATECNKGRTESLFSLHSRKRLSAPQEERRPFDRERDLQVSRVVPAAKRQDIMKESSHKLHSKFTHSSQQKYL